MNLLADESVDSPIVERLRQDGHAVFYIAELDPGIGDGANPVHRTLSPLAQTRRPDGNFPAGRHSRKTCRRVHPVVDTAARVGPRQRRPAGGALHRRGQRQHPHQLVVPEEAPRGRPSRSYGECRGLPGFHGGRRKGRFDRRGNALYKRSPDGQEIARDVEHVDSIAVGQRKVARTLRRKEPI